MARPILKKSGFKARVNRMIRQLGEPFAIKRTNVQRAVITVFYGSPWKRKTRQHVMYPQAGAAQVVAEY